MNEYPKLTMELFAYLIYKNGAIATNGELIGILWDGNPEKQDLLRKHIKDMRDCFEAIGAEDVLIKKRGSIGADMLKIYNLDTIVYGSYVII